MTNSKYAELLGKFQTEIGTAVGFSDPNWTHSAITRERIKRMSAAQATLRDALDAIPPQATTQDIAPLRQAALEQLRPHNADTVAVANNEWAKVQKLLDAGWNFDQLIQQADRPRLTAILDQLPTELAAKSTDPEGVIAEVEQLTIDRLAELGDKKATDFADAKAAAGYDVAWKQVIEQAAVGHVSVEAWTALYNSAREEYRSAMDAYTDHSELAAKLEQLSRLADTMPGV